MGRQDRIYKGHDGDFHYIDWGGRGPVAHFSHATGLCAGAYTPFAQRLSGSLHVTGMDDRGHGKTTAPADPRKIRTWNIFADDLANFFEYLGPPVVAMGHSLGATASLLLAVRRPELVRALVLIDPTILPLSWMWWWYLAKKTGLAARVPIVATAAKRKNSWPDRHSILETYRKKTVFRKWQDGFLQGYIADGTRQSDSGTIKLCCEPAWESRCFAACPHDIWRQVPRLTQPTLVLYGADSDTFLASAVRRFKSAVPHAVFKRFKNTGHFVPMQRPDESAAAILSFLKANGII